MADGSKTIRELVDQFHGGELALPTLQRDYVWKSTQVRDLIDSLYREYPSGAILTWRMPKGTQIRSAAVLQRGNLNKATELLLDGQQRITSLSLLMRGEPVPVKNRKRPIDILFNLEHPDKTLDLSDEDDSMQGLSDEERRQLIASNEQKRAFVVASNSLLRQKNWISVTEIFNGQVTHLALRNRGYDWADERLFQKCLDRIERVKQIRNYAYPITTIPASTSYEEVTKIFVRVNSLGARLRSSDLAFAQITAIWAESRAEIEQYQKETEQSQFPIEISIILRTLVAFAKDNVGMKDQAKFSNVTQLPQEALKRSWEDTKDCLNSSINFLRQEMGIEKPILLSSPFLIVALAYFIQKNKPQNTASMREWVKRCNMKARYSRGSSETILGQDIISIRNNASSLDLLTNIKKQVGKLGIDPEDLKSLKSGSAYFKTMFLAFKANGAKDWFTSRQTISASSIGAKHSIEGHHIFPKSVLSSNGVSNDDINDISNLTFIERESNQKIGNRLPADYLSELTAEDLKAHCIPNDKSLWQVSRYSDFLTERRKLIAKCLNDYCDG